MEVLLDDMVLFVYKKKKGCPKFALFVFDEVDFGHFSDLRGQTNFDAGKK